MGDAAEQGGADTIPPAAIGSPMTNGSALVATHSYLAIATYRNCERVDMWTVLPRAIEFTIARRLGTNQFKAPAET